MELGALVCVPGAPQCQVCPLQELCSGYASGRAASLPVKPPKKEKKKVPVTVALIESEAGYLLQRRPARGLLANLWQPLCFEGESLTREELAGRLEALGVAVTWQEALAPARHVFTHRIWELSGWRGTASACDLPEGLAWGRADDATGNFTVPSAFAAYVPGAGNQ